LERTVLTALLALKEGLSLIIGLWGNILKGAVFGVLIGIPAILVLIFVLWLSAYL
jgi:hypothetical protein